MESLSGRITQAFVASILLGMMGPIAAAGASEATGSVVVFPNQVTLRHAGASVQLVVSQTDPNGVRRDQTSVASFRSLTPEVLDVDASGRVSPVGPGAGQIEVTIEGQRATAAFRVENLDDSQPPDFETEIQPILASLGCSTGACHGKQGGQNGFQLSLLGFDSDFDYAALTRAARGRRLSLAAPAESLILQKATARIPHGGGERTRVGELHYRLLLDWIRAAAPRRGPDPVALESIEIVPSTLTMAQDDRHRVAVVASFSDGSRRDVTELSALSSNESGIVQVVDGTVLQSGEVAGEAAIMARFMNQITACYVLVPRAERVAHEVYAALPVNNVIDRLVWNKLESLAIRPSPPASDSKFIRRAYIDIIGRLPGPDEVRSFVADSDPDKRQRLVDQLLEHPGYADHWANKWVDLLRPNPYRVGIKAVLNFDNWIRQAFRENRPYDEFVAGLLTAEGSTWRNGATTLFRDRRSPDELAAMVSQLFLGVRLECARCHHHPFEVWSQDDFYSFAAYFARVGRKGTGLSPPISGGEEIIYVADSGTVEHPRTGKTMTARPPGAAAPESSDARDPREALIEWMTGKGSAYFSRVIANRVWADLMGRGLVEPVDDLRATNPASNEPLLDALAEALRKSDYDLKQLIRLIATSHVYSLDSVPNPSNLEDHRNYSRHYRKRLRAEVLLDAANDVTGTSTDWQAMPTGARSNAIWTHRIPSLFLDTFGRPDPNQDPPCERTRDTAVVQALHLMNSPELHAKVTSDQGRAARLAASDLSPDAIVTELYLRAYARYPTDEELQIGVDWMQRPGKPRRQAVEDILWALLNSAEFVFND